MNFSLKNTSHIKRYLINIISICYVCMYMYVYLFAVKKVQVCNGIKYSRHDKAENQH